MKSPWVAVLTHQRLANGSAEHLLASRESVNSLSDAHIVRTLTCIPDGPLGQTRVIPDGDPTPLVRGCR